VPEPRSVPEPGRSALDAAQDAANAGDHHAAERLLRDALRLQETTLGRAHPDLVNTLNNLAVMCEHTGKLADAEQGYRRAHAIAVASLPPGHPSIAASLRNLVEFCTARGIPLWTPPRPAGAEDAASSNPIQPGPGLAITFDTPHDAPSLASESAFEPANWIGSRDHRWAGLLAIVILVVVSLGVLIWAAPWRSRNQPAGDAPAAAAAAPDPSSGVDPTPAAPPDASTGAPLPAPPVARDREAVPPPIERKGSIAGATTGAGVTVLAAAVCRALERRGSPDWRCTPAAEFKVAETVTFYTRLRSATNTTVEHRWYRNDRLHQTMRLRVQANPANGYRTYSRTTISAGRSGDWRVELRTTDGSLLTQFDFVVR
jgi:hypothetical protein